MIPRVTIVIPFYNCSYIDQAIQSALGQSYSSVEVIVVDDGSTQHVERIAPYRSSIHYLGKANGGTATALNHGIRHASGDYIAWLSSDDVLYPDKIRNQVSFMLEQHAYISHTNFNYIDSEGNVTQYNAAPAQMLQSTLEFYRCFLKGNPVNGCTVMIKKDLFNVIGLFDETLLRTHDFDFWYRAVQSGVHFPFLNETHTAYRWHDAMGTVRHQDQVVREFNSIQERLRDRHLQILSQLNF